MTKAADDSARYFLLHVPKCAGSTVIGHMDEHLGARSMQAPLWHSPFRNFLGNRYPFSPEDPRIADVRVFHGHALSRSLRDCLPGAEIREAVTLRDPVGYFTSLYNFRAMRAANGLAAEDPPFGTWYAAQRRNPIARFPLYRYFGWTPWQLWLRSSRAKLVWLERQLAGFWFVGSYRDVALMVNAVAEVLEIPGDPVRRNESVNRKVSAESLPPAFRARIEEENALDAALNARWTGRNFDRAANPAVPVRELSARDVPAQVGAEVLSGFRKLRIRLARRAAPERAVRSRMRA